MLKWTGERLTRPQPYTKSYATEGSWEWGRCPFPEKSTPVGCQYQMTSPEHICTSNITWTEQLIFRNMHVLTYICTDLQWQLVKKRGQEFEGKEEGIFVNYDKGKESE